MRVVCVSHSRCEIAVARHHSKAWNIEVSGIQVGSEFPKNLLNQALRFRMVYAWTGLFILAMSGYQKNVTNPATSDKVMYRQS